MQPVHPSPLLAKALPVCVDGDMTFSEPWEAKAFAIIVKLAQAGHFAWSEWVDVFAKEVAAATAVEQANGIPKSYYEQWLDAAETLIVAKGFVSREQLFAKRFSVGAVGNLHLMK